MKSFMDGCTGYTGPWVRRAPGLRFGFEAFHCNFVGWQQKRSVGRSSLLHDLAQDNMKF